MSTLIKLQVLFFREHRFHTIICFSYGDQQIEFVTEFNYLWSHIFKNGSFTAAKKTNVRKAIIAMYEMLFIALQVYLVAVNLIYVWMQSMGFYKYRHTRNGPSQIL